MNKIDFSRQVKLFENIISKSETWESDYDQLFVELIKYALKIINMKCEWKKVLHFENEDFLGNCFQAYIKTINTFIKENDKNFNNFKIQYGYNIRNECRYLWRRFSNNKHRILNECLSYSFFDGKEDQIVNFSTDCEYLNQNYIEDTLSKNPLVYKIVKYKAQNLTTNEICKKLNINLSSFYRIIQTFKKSINV